jgi:2-dehydropantoate 2-reductase
MKIAILGGAGAMGSLFGSQLAAAGEDVTLVDPWQAAVDAINTNGLRVDDKSGASQVIRVPATTDPAVVGPTDLVIVFVKCYHTEAAVRSAASLVGPHTQVLSLQNGWGNAPRIAAIVGPDPVMVGVTYHSATTLGPGHVLHAGSGMTYIGELKSQKDGRLSQISTVLRHAGFDVTPTETVRNEIWSKLALNSCTLPVAALLRFYAGQLGEHAGTLDLMQAILHEVVTVANAQDIALSYDERWEAITGVLKRAAGARGSMLQDVEKQRRTEIDVINGAIVEAGRQFHIATPYNEAMVWLIRALEETFAAPGAPA